jgi:TolB protein
MLSSKKINNVMMRSGLGVLFGFILAWFPLTASAQFRVEISGVGANQIPIAVAKFQNEANIPQPISSIVMADLERSGLFTRIDDADVLKNAVMTERTQPNFNVWRSKGTDALLSGSIARLSDGRFDIRYRLWDVVKGSDLGGKSSAVQEADLRLAAHRIADDIYQRLTGEKGIFSTRIAFVTRSGRSNQLRITDADGEGGKVAVNSAEPIISPVWSPDGRELAYVSFESQKAVVWVQTVSNGQRRMLANFKGSNSAPAWSPDGSQLALTLTRDGGSQIYLIGRNGGEPRRLTTSSGIDTEPVFTPDGKFIYFVSDRTGGPQIYRMAVDKAAPERVTFEGSYNISPAISPDGRYLAFVSRVGGAYKLMIQSTKGGSAMPLSDTSDDQSPSFAPNGKMIIYATRIKGREVLMTTTLDGKIKTRLLTTDSDVLEPAWAPFGR